MGILGRSRRCAVLLAIGLVSLVLLGEDSSDFARAETGDVVYEEGFQEDSGEASFADDNFCEGDCCCGDVCCGDPVCGDACCWTACGGDGNGEGANLLWITGEYIYWQTDGQALPPLVTSAPANTPLASAGELGNPSTTNLSGNETVNDDFRSGFRVGGGIWINPCCGLAIVGDYFELEDDDYDFSQGPNGTIITRPFFNSELGEQDTELVNVPNQLQGRVDVSASDDFNGAGLGLQACLCCCRNPCGGGHWVAVVGGYRNYNYDSDLVIHEDLLVLPGTTTPLVPGTEILVEDSFRATNEFHGGELGLAGRFERRFCWLDGLAAVAVGANNRDVFIDGSTDTTVPGGGSSSAAGGLLTSSVTNIGHYSDSKVAVIPRFRVGVGCQLTKHFSVRSGYNLILWNDVVQAATSLPPWLAVDPRNLPPVQTGGNGDPRFPGLVGSSLVVHGFDAGVTFQY